MVRFKRTPCCSLLANMFVWLLLCICPFVAAIAETQYYYDDLGRLILTVYTDGAAIAYEHDADGNINAVHQWAGDGLVIGTFSPSNGPAGTQVTISGSGYDPTPSQNQVTIGGAVAAVSSASATTLIATVPLEAQTGPIAVTTGGESATSAQHFVVQKPLITSFSPVIVNPGDPVVLSGANLDLAVGSTSVSVAGVTANLTSITNNQIVFEAPNGTGRIVVHTSYGQAISTSNLVVVPSPIGAEDVVDYSVLESGTPESLSIDQQNKYGIVEFDAVQGEWLNLDILSISTTPAGNNVSYELFSPTGVSLDSGSVPSGSPAKVFLPKIAMAGRHLIAFASGSSTSVEVTAQVSPSPQLDSTGAPLSISNTAPGEENRIVFTATAGDDLGLAMMDLTVSVSNYVRVDVYRPNGVRWRGFYCYTYQTPGCSVDMRDAPETGDYLVHVEPYTAQSSYSLVLSRHVDGGTLALDTPQTIAATIPGQRALFDFTATAGQTVALNMDAIAMTPTGKLARLYVHDPNGNQIASADSSSSITHNLTSLAAGTYRALVMPHNAATGSVKVDVQ